MKSVNPYLNFNGNAEEAFSFYESVFGGDVMLSRYGELGDDMGASGVDIDKIANAMLPLGSGAALMGSDVLGEGSHAPSVGNAFYINLETESEEESKRLYDALSDGGEVEMDLQEVEWAKLFAMFADKFGVRWMVYYPGG